MAVKMQTQPQIAVATETIAKQTATKSIATTSGVVIIGRLMSTNATFQRDFPNADTANQWLATDGGAADVEVFRVEPVMFVK